MTVNIILTLFTTASYSDNMDIYTNVRCTMKLKAIIIVGVLFIVAASLFFISRIPTLTYDEFYDVSQTMQLEPEVLKPDIMSIGSFKVPLKLTVKNEVGVERAKELGELYVTKIAEKLTAKKAPQTISIEVIDQKGTVLAKGSKKRSSDKIKWTSIE